MFFVVSKLVWFVIQPLVALAFVALVGVLAAWLGFRALASGLFVFAGLAYVVVMFSPAGLLMLGFLEDRFPRPTNLGRVDGIVVLGGSFDTRVAMTRGEPELSDAGDRITSAMVLARQHPQAKVLFTGGVAAVFEDDIAEVDVAARVFGALGLEPERLILEGEARNTTENAIFSKRIAQPKPGENWLLVTSAFHMPRSVGCFRAAGFDVVPFPVDFRTPTGSARWRPASNDVSRNADKVQLAIREFIGLLGYRLSGRIPELLPGPARSPSASGSPSL